jgi:hypothetical protein
MLYPTYKNKNPPLSPFAKGGRKVKTDAESSSP